MSEKSSSNNSTYGGSIEPPTGQFNPEIPKILPHEKMFSIQVGNKLFRLSGASLSSDAPSYFTNYFLPHKDKEENEQPKLYLDRSAVVFEMIAQHLQGYYIVPEDEIQFTWLFIDSQYYNLPRLTKQLTQSEVFIRIGERKFRVPRDIFSNPGDHPNFLTHGFQAFFGHELDKVISKGFLRPPPIAPPTITNRSGELFEQLLNILRGQHVEITSDAHRQALLRECKFYRFKGLEQKLISYNVVWTGLEGTESKEMREEIVVNLVDIRIKELSKGEAENMIYYKRPYIDEPLRQLIFQIKDITVRIILEPLTQNIFAVPPNSLLAKFEKMMKTVSELFNASYSLQTKMDHADLVVDGKEMTAEEFPNILNEHGKRTKTPEICLAQSQWRLLLADDVIQLELVKGIGYSTARSRNKLRDFV